MKKADVIKVSLEIQFGSMPKEALKSFVNLALDSGEYYDGFELAIQKGEFEYKEYEELYRSFSYAYGEYIPDLTELVKVVEAEFGKSYFSLLSWLISDDGEIYLTDGFRVLKFFECKLIWCTPRVSYDGINLLYLKANELIGEWFSPLDEAHPWRALKLDLSDGALIQGQVVE